MIYVLDGGNPLNFKVVGNPQPASPKENTIWVNTDEEITGYIFSVTQPLLDGEDLYAKAEKKTGYYVNASGNEVSGANHEILTIDLPEGATHIIVTAGNYSTSTVSHCFYDASGKFISSVLRTIGTLEYAVPSEAKSVRVSLRPEDTKSVIVCDSSKQEGKVWILTGTSDLGKFNALKKNRLMVYPQSAKQYVDGAWVGKVLKIYQNGAWSDLRLYLLDAGVPHEITGGFVGIQGVGSTLPTVSFDTEGQMTLSIGGWSQGNAQGGVYSVNLIDVTPYKKLTFVIAVAKNVQDAGMGRVGITSTKDGSYTSVASVAPAATTGEQTIEVDVSSVTGQYYVQMIMRGQYDGIGNTWAVKNIYLE